ncbi:OsmC family peroxiredoxin [Mesorhizobium sp. ESP7-2]|uniref:OsmC family peroxiredoxin n=1 Tax=Mesorhizobium sp. ESP7-2 TaxID=2876622 RepID=UPI002962021D|nr:OsmC family peroxiredoxin [Mesorhizobium sp. ESP7-2]
MTIRDASAEWQGTLKEGSGRLRLGSGVFEGAYSFPSRFENGPGTNPEELIAAAHAGCFSMALTAIIGSEGHIPSDIHTIAKVHLGPPRPGRRLPASTSRRRRMSPGLPPPTSSGWRSRPRLDALSRGRWPASPRSP